MVAACSDEDGLGKFNICIGNLTNIVGDEVQSAYVF
jgi:hypothetical protein